MMIRRPRYRSSLELVVGQQLVNGSWWGSACILLYKPLNRWGFITTFALVSSRFLSSLLVKVEAFSTIVD
jgi:hypothetical protein